jgi:glycine/D-amino acid oxidase-like deaminating enzyme/thioredoxin reductase/Fe-S-cluster-containing hydrogenase component 2
MERITKHPIIEVKPCKEVNFLFNGKEITGCEGYTIAAALHQAGFPIHSHSLRRRSRSLECGIGKCGACEMLVDGEVKRICMTVCDGVKEVCELAADFIPRPRNYLKEKEVMVYKTRVVIVGAGPAGLAARQKLNEFGIANIVIDSQDRIGGQFLMQTHQFFFFEQEKKFGGMRGFEIARTLAGDSHEGIMLDCTVWDILEGGRIAVKNTRTDEIFYVDCRQLVVAAGAVPFLPPFQNDDLPGVYTAAVVQKMMNIEMTLLGKRVLTVGAGNIGYLTSYQLMQAGARVKAIIEAQPREGGFPVQANRVRRLGIPVYLSKVIIKAIPNAAGDGLSGVVVADARNFKPVPGTEQIIDGIDIVNICTGLVPDSQLLTKGREVFGTDCYGAGDALRIGEGTSAVLRGTQVAYEIMNSLNLPYDYEEYLKVSKDYIDSQQHPIRILDEVPLPPASRREKPFVSIDCTYGFACNPCAFACPHGAITKSSSSTVPRIDYALCTGCMKCVTLCPGLAIFGYNLKKKQVFLPIEFDKAEGADVFLVDNNGRKLGEGRIEKIIRKQNLTHLVRVDASTLSEESILAVRGFINREDYPEEVHYKADEAKSQAETYICHCDDVKLEEVLAVIGDRKFISVDEIKHTTRLGMGACRGKRCFGRLKQALRPLGIQVIGEPTPRAPLANQIGMGEVYPAGKPDRILSSAAGKPVPVKQVKSFVAGGGIGGSALFRYLAEAGLEPLLINCGLGASWRNIAGGRPAFSVPELADIAEHNLEIFKSLQETRNIDFRLSHYVTFAHDEASYKTLEASMAWQDAYWVQPDRFQAEISPYFNPNLKKYIAAQKTRNCWQATPGKTIDVIRHIGLDHGGSIYEDCEIIDLDRQGGEYKILVRRHNGSYEEYRTELFVNALGPNADKFTLNLGLETGVYPVKHQAFITRRLPPFGVGGEPLPMLIDRRVYKGFVAVYGQQLGETGQVIGCASPQVEPRQAGRSLKVNDKEFLEIVSEIFVDWIPQLSSAGFQAVWAGYYVEPKMIIDPEVGLFVGLRGQGFMLSQYLAKLYVDALAGREVPSYFERLKIGGDGLLETAFG